MFRLAFRHEGLRREGGAEGERRRLERSETQKLGRRRSKWAPIQGSNPSTHPISAHGDSEAPSPHPVKHYGTPFPHFLFFPPLCLHAIVPSPCEEGTVLIPQRGDKKEGGGLHLIFYSITRFGGRSNHRRPSADAGGGPDCASKPAEAAFSRHHGV